MSLYLSDDHNVKGNAIKVTIPNVIIKIANKEQKSLSPESGRINNTIAGVKNNGNKRYKLLTSPLTAEMINSVNATVYPTEANVIEITEVCFIVS